MNVGPDGKLRSRDFLRKPSTKSLAAPPITIRDTPSTTLENDESEVFLSAAQVRALRDANKAFEPDWPDPTNFESFANAKREQLLSRNSAPERSPATSQTSLDFRLTSPAVGTPRAPGALQSSPTEGSNVYNEGGRSDKQWFRTLSAPAAAARLASQNSLQDPQKTVKNSSELEKAKFLSALDRKSSRGSSKSVELGALRERATSPLDKGSFGASPAPSDSLVIESEGEGSGELGGEQVGRAESIRRKGKVSLEAAVAHTHVDLRGTHRTDSPKRPVLQPSEGQRQRPNTWAPARQQDSFDTVMRQVKDGLNQFVLDDRVLESSPRHEVLESQCRLAALHSTLKVEIKRNLRDKIVGRREEDMLEGYLLLQTLEARYEQHERAMKALMLRRYTLQPPAPTYTNTHTDQNIDSSQPQRRKSSHHGSDPGLNRLNRRGSASDGVPAHQGEDQPGRRHSWVGKLWSRSQSATTMEAPSGRVNSAGQPVPLQKVSPARARAHVHTSTTNTDTANTAHDNARSSFNDSTDEDDDRFLTRPAAREPSGSGHSSYQSPGSSLNTRTTTQTHTQPAVVLPSSLEDIPLTPHQSVDRGSQGLVPRSPMRQTNVEGGHEVILEGEGESESASDPKRKRSIKKMMRSLSEQAVGEGGWLSWRLSRGKEKKEEEEGEGEGDWDSMRAGWLVPKPHTVKRTGSAHSSPNVSH